MFGTRYYKIWHFMYEVKVVTYHPFLSVGYMRNMKNIDKMYLPMWDKILVKSFPLESRPLLLRRLCEHYTIWFPSFSHQGHERIYLGSSSWEYKDSEYQFLCVCVCVCVCVVTYQEAIWSHTVSCNSTRFWHCLPGDSIRCHRIRVHSHRYASPPTIDISWKSYL